MKLFAIFVMNNRMCRGGADVQPLIITASKDLSSFGYFQRSSADEFMVFLARTIAKRVPAGRSMVKQDQNIAYAHCHPDGFCVIAVCDDKYNDRVAFSMLNQVANDFVGGYRGRWEDAPRDNCLQWPELDQTLAKYQKPEEADKILKIKKEIEETKAVMYDAIDQLLERGEKIDNLVAKSDDLGAASKTFYKSAKQTNSCCVIC